MLSRIMVWKRSLLDMNGHSYEIAQWMSSLLQQTTCMINATAIPKNSELYSQYNKYAINCFF